MNFTLSPELEQRIQEKIDSGAYASVNALLAEALELLEDRERSYSFDSDAVRAAIQRSIDEIEAGQGLDGQTFFRGLLNKGKARTS